LGAPLIGRAHFFKHCVVRLLFFFGDMGAILVFVLKPFSWVTHEITRNEPGKTIALLVLLCRCVGKLQ
jgi:hypothetical protein